jgi:hypothetical protein
MNQLTKITDKLDNQGQTIQNLTEKLDIARSTISDLTRTMEDNKCFRSIYAFTEPKHVGNKRLTWRANNFFNHMRKIGRFMEMPENVFKGNFECNFKEMSKYFNIFLHSANLHADGKFFEATKFLEEDGGIAGLDYIERKGRRICSQVSRDAQIAKFQQMYEDSKADLTSASDFSDDDVEKDDGEIMKLTKRLSVLTMNHRKKRHFKKGNNNNNNVRK